jgi:NAD(P)-dependent dehydrogenase (short-subunit alcohol dehydrogenase family)
MSDQKKPDQVPGQTQSKQPGEEKKMTPKPQAEKSSHRGSGRLEGRVALITGGDSGIGRAVAIAFAKEGCDVAVSYLNEHDDAKETAERVRELGRKCELLPGDVGDSKLCQELVERTVKTLGRLDILVNNAAEQHPKKSVTEISDEQLERTFRTNIFSQFYLVRAALPHLRRQKGATIINTSSVTAYRGSEHLLDYSSTKGAIVSFTRSLSKALAPEKIRVNGVAPGPIWTPLIPATFPKEKVESFGQDVPMERPGQPEEVALCYVFLASNESSYMTGQVLHPNGGEVING